MNSIIDLRSASVRLGGRPVLEALDLQVGSGELVEVTGPNGSGKTTLLRLLATLLRPSHGTALVFEVGVDTPQVRNVRSSIGFITHQPALIEELTLEENLVHFARLRQVDAARCTRALDVVGLQGSGGRRAGEASFGMRRRAEIAWQLVSKPELLLLDEARSGLDSEARDLISAVVGSTIQRGGAVVAVSHEKTELGTAGGGGAPRAFQLVGGSLEAVR